VESGYPELNLLLVFYRFSVESDATGMGKKGNWFSSVKKAFSSNSKEQSNSVSSYLLWISSFLSLMIIFSPHSRD